jgi:uncharacterized membrane protein
MNNAAGHLLQSEKEQLEKFRQIVDQAISDEKLIVENLANEPDEPLTKGQRISDKVASFGGSWRFIILFGIILTIWIIINALLPQGTAFDPYPFILMNLILSCIAALQAPIIMMSQNRKEEKDRQRSQNDYLINLKAELELRSLHSKIDLLLEEQIKVLFDSQSKQLEILTNIESSLKNKSGQK